MHYQLWVQRECLNTSLLQGIKCRIQLEFRETQGCPDMLEEVIKQAMELASLSLRVRKILNRS